MKNPPTAKPTRGEFGLPDRPTLPKDHRQALEALIKHQLEAWDLDWDLLVDDAAVLDVKARLEGILLEIGVASKDALWERAARTIGLDDNVMEILAAERRYKQKTDEWEQYQTWLASRNEKRAALEARFGYDTKHGMHLVRLMRMAREILTTGEVRVERPDREELLAIRDGELPYEQLLAYAKEQDALLGAAYDASTLPREPDRQAIDALCVELVESMP